MVENKIISFSDIAYVLGMGSKKLSRWYKHVLSGYIPAKLNGEIIQHDYKDKHLSRTVRVPIVNTDFFGTEIAIDEKHIRGRYHTILSDIKTGKIILMARTIKSRELYSIVRQHLPLEQRTVVKVITKDGAEAFDWLARQAFPNALKVLDKFHVLKWAFDALQSVRIQLRTNHIIEQQKKQDLLNRKYMIDAKIAKKNNTKIKRSDYKIKEVIHPNGDTTKELLTRSRYLLFKYEDQWNTNQENRAQILFDLFPEFLDIYILILDFRMWYSKDDIGMDLGTKKFKLDNWIIKLKACKNDHISALATTIKRHSGQIINYFIEGYTNASAEALNRNIKRFIGVNYGIRELNYFYYRLDLLNSSTSI